MISTNYHQVGLLNSLFKVAVSGQEQDVSCCVPRISRNKVTGQAVIRYSGPHLGMEHFKAWRALIFLWERNAGRGGGDTTKVRRTELLRLMGRDYRDHDCRSRLLGLLDDLCCARMEVRQEHEQWSAHFVGSYAVPARNSRDIFIRLDQSVIEFMMAAGALDGDVERMRDFGRHYLALWLWNLFSNQHLKSSDANQVVLAVDYLRKACGTTVKSRSHFVQMLTVALDRLKSGDSPIIHGWNFAGVGKADLEVYFPIKKKASRPLRTPGFVYILTNPAMPGLIKIGKTRLAPADRAAQLHTTGVPAGFQVEYACRTPNPEAVEQAMHVAFGPTRLSHKREFFQLSVEQAIAVLSLHHQDEAGQACA